MISVNGVRKRYGDQQVLDGVSFHVRAGTVTTIIGRSGGGKTVLLKHMIGLETPDAGEIVVDGENLIGMRGPALNRIRRRFGVLFQEGALLDSLTARENVAFPLREHSRLSDSEIDTVVTSRLATVGLAEHGDKYPSQISTGMRRRVGLARALALDPDIVFFDEPTAGLDPITTSAIYALILRTHRERSVTYVLVSHDIEGVFAISDEVMMLWDGKIVASGEPIAIKNSSDPVIQQFVTGSLKGPILID